MTLVYDVTPRGRAIETAARGKELSERQCQVLTLAAQGWLSKEIGRHLGDISDRTIEIHKANCIAKLGARNQVHAVAIAVSQGIINLNAVIPEQERQRKRGGRPAKLRDASAEDAAKWLKNGGRLS